MPDPINPTITELTRENDALRAIAAKIMPCHYCGVTEIAKCPRGFPGCALMDDVICGEESVMHDYRKLKEAAQSTLSFLEELHSGCNPISSYRVKSVIDQLKAAL